MTKINQLKYVLKTPYFTFLRTKNYFLFLNYQTSLSIFLFLKKIKLFLKTISKHTLSLPYLYNQSHHISTTSKERKKRTMSTRVLLCLQKWTSCCCFPNLWLHQLYYQVQKSLHMNILIDSEYRCSLFRAFVQPS